MDQVGVRIDKDRERLDGGKVSSARELESLQSEVASLQRRQSDLEEVVLKLMERREAAQARRDAAAIEQGSVQEQSAGVTARRDAALQEISEQADKASAARASVAAGVPADVLALYDKLRVQFGGVGAAMLRRGRCEGCHVSLSTVDLNAIRAAAPTRWCAAKNAGGSWSGTADSGL